MFQKILFLHRFKNYSLQRFYSKIIFKKFELLFFSVIHFFFFEVQKYCELILLGKVG